MSVLLRLLANKNLKNGIALVYDILTVAANAINGVLASDTISESARQRLITVIRALMVIRDFIGKMADIFGVSLTHVAVLSSSELDDSVKKLDDIIGRM